MKLVRWSLLALVVVVALVIAGAALIDPVAVFFFDGTGLANSIGDVVGFVLGWAMILTIMLVCAVITAVSIFGSEAIAQSWSTICFLAGFVVRFIWGPPGTYRGPSPH